MVSVGIQPKIEHVFFNTIAQKFQPLLYLFLLGIQPKIKVSI